MADPSPEVVAPSNVGRAVRGRFRRGAIIGLLLVGVPIIAWVGWTKYTKHKQHQREEQVLSFLVDEFVKQSAELKSPEYEKVPPCPTQERDTEGKMFTVNFCSYINLKNREFVEKHEYEMNEFIWNHQLDPRVPTIQRVLWSWDMYAKLTCKQMKAGVSRWSVTDPKFRANYSNYDLYEAGCL